MNPQIKAIAAALDYIEGHLCEPITVGDIADAAGYSLFHFIRTFNKIIGHTPYDYLMRRRFSHAAELLFKTESRVLDIALTCQFDSHEGFTRAFRRLFGIPPITWRERKTSDWRVLIPALKQEDLVFRQVLDFTQPEIIHQEKLCLAGWMTIFTPETGSEESFRQLFLQSLSGKPVPGCGKGLWEVRQPANSDAQGDMYFIGVRVSEERDIPDPYVSKVIKGGQFLCFSHPKAIEYREAAFHYLYHTFLPKSGLDLVDPVEVLHHGEPPTLMLPVEKASSNSKD